MLKNANISMNEYKIYFCIFNYIVFANRTNIIGTFKI